MGKGKYLPKQEKLEVLYRIWAGEKITQVARDCGISRQVIYIWKRRAEIALYQALEEKRRGPKIQNLSPDHGVEQVQEGVENSSRKLEQTQQQMGTLQESYNSFNTSDTSKLNTDDEKKPQRCPVCGCEKIYKNGTYIRRTKDSRWKKKRVVQRYICAWCKNSLY